METKTIYKTKMQIQWIKISIKGLALDKECNVTKLVNRSIKFIKLIHATVTKDPSDLLRQTPKSCI